MERKFHYKWGKRLPKPDYVSLEQLEWDALTARQRYELRYPDKTREQKSDQHQKDNLKKNFGLSVEEYQQMFYEQNGVCAICGLPETRVRNGVTKRLAVDHNHETGQIRKLLCQDCNIALGYVRENIDILESMIEYLRWYLNGTV